MFALLRVRDFGLLGLAGLISIAADLALVVALPLHVYRLTDSTVATDGSGGVSPVAGISGWRWSSPIGFVRRCCCRAAEWWSGRSPGCPVSDGWPMTMNVCWGR